MERFIARVFAPENMTFQGRVVVLTVWTILAICAMLGASKLETNFSVEYFIPNGSEAEKYLELDKEYFATGFEATVYMDNADFDHASARGQYTMLDFFDKLERSYLCDESWFV